MAASDRHVIPGSDKQAPANARAQGPVQASERIELTVLVRRRAGVPPAGSARLSPQDFAAAHGADQADLDAVRAFATEHGLEVLTAEAATRSLTLAGPAAAVQAAFEVQLTRYEADGVSFRGRSGPVLVPTALAGVVDGVLGLDDRPVARPHFRLRPQSPPVTGQPAAGEASGQPTTPTAPPMPSTRSPSSRPFTPLELAALYDFPTGGDGSGQTVGIIELGGGYRSADLSTYFAGLGLAPPTVSAVGVDGGANTPTGDPNGPDGEVVLDIEVAGAVAPRAHYATYFAPNTDRGFLDAITTAVHDQARRPSVVSISWGGAESSWTAQSLRAFDDAFAAAAALGVTVCAASGDDGSGDRVADGKAHVDFPASSPHVLACGGTRVVAAGATITEETVWNDGAGGGAGGGGVSVAFALPAYQRQAGVPAPPADTPPVAGMATGRGVPDVAGDADPVTGYRIHVDGQDVVVGGTSAVAPLWAGLVARLNQLLGTPVGFLHPALYAVPPTAGALRDVTAGDNGAYAAGPGWDACTGLGSPVGSRLLDALRRPPGPPPAAPPAATPPATAPPR